MAVETYSWRSQLGAGAIEYSQTVRSAQFGDGYEQVADNGINSTAIQVPMKHVGTDDEVNAVRDFLLAHTVKAFIITPPGEVKGMYRVVADSIRKNQLSSKFSELTFTIKRAYGVFS
ncbi:TPA: phage tail protein [Citrobacter freundii]|nr:phage tail protein [Citrobacter freundii]